MTEQANKADFLLLPINEVRTGKANGGMRPGWAVGPFYPAGDPRFCAAFEVKEWNFPLIQRQWKSHPGTGIEYVAVKRGTLIVELGRSSKSGEISPVKRIEVPAGHSLVLRPGLWRRYDGSPDVEGISVRAAAAPGSGRTSPAPAFTAKQGQYLAFIRAYALMFGQAPAEADLQRHFQVTPPSVHQMILTLERTGLIRRRPGVARSIELLVDADALPPLAGVLRRR
jgi:hypothetical protein